MFDSLKTEKTWGREILMHFETYIGLIAFIYITIVLTIQVIGRYVFKISWAWIEETSIIGFVILIYSGVSGAVTTRQNMRIDMLLSIAPFKIKKVMMILSAIIHAGFTGFLTYFLYQIVLNMMKMKQVYTVTRLPKVYIYGIMVFLLTLSILRAVQEVIKLLKEQPQELGKSKSAFDLDAIWEEGVAERKAYMDGVNVKRGEGK
ncbi:MAG: TRAP transporter small permease [Clostridiales bacterium]|nr:TRAP transporter small permease [Clostridiales bacterium]